MSGNLEEVILPEITSYRSLGFAPLLFLIWMCGIGYSIVKYRLFTITPESVSSNIIANIDESIMLLDHRFSVSNINVKTDELLKLSGTDITGKDISDFIIENEVLKDEMIKMIDNEYKDFSCRVHYIRNNGEDPVAMDIKVSVFKDKFDDISGILLIGREVKEIKQLRQTYAITGRQAEIIQYLISGLTNKEIGRALGITERTVKGHLTAIFTKINVNNKIELINHLKNYNLLPGEIAERTILLAGK